MYSPQITRKRDLTRRGCSGHFFFRRSSNARHIHTHTHTQNGQARQNSKRRHQKQAEILVAHPCTHTPSLSAVSCSSSKNYIANCFEYCITAVAAVVSCRAEQHKRGTATQQTVACGADYVPRRYNIFAAAEKNTASRREKGITHTSLPYRGTAAAVAEVLQGESQIHGAIL